MDLKTKLAFALVSASLLSMAAFGYFTHLSAEDLFLEDDLQQLNALAESRKREIDEVFGRWSEETHALVDLIQSALLTGRQRDASDAELLDTSGRILRDAESSSDSLRSVSLSGVQGSLPLGSVGTRLEAFATIPDDDVVFSGVRVEPDGSTSVVLHAWVLLDGERVGLLEVVFRADSLGRLVGYTPSIGESGETWLIVPSRMETTPTGSDADAYLLVGSLGHGAVGEVAPRSMTEAPTATAAALRGEENLFAAVVDQRGHEVMAATRFLPHPGWGLVVTVDSSEVRQRADRLLATMRDLGVSLAAFATLGGVLLGLHLGRPLHRLKQDVDRIRHGELGLRLDARGEDEVAFLAQSLNEFMDQLDRSSDLFRLAGLRVLLIDASAASRQLLGDLLVNWNMRPTLAEGGVAAVRELEQAGHAGQPHQLVVLDDAITDMDLTGLAERLRSSSSGPSRIILLASKPEELDAQRLKECGIGKVLPKPVVASHLMGAILDAMGVSAESLASTADTYLKRASPRRILLAEDDPLMQQVLMAFLEKWGHEVMLAENGRIALEFTQRVRFDLILMDVMMPEMNGLEAAAAIRANASEDAERTPIVALTAEAHAGDRERCIAAGMDDHIAKPVDPKALYALIERYPARVRASATAGGKA